MTNEEAISVLEESKRQNEIMRDNPNTFFKVSDIVTGEKNAQKRIDALNMAIYALRQQEHFRDLTKKMEPMTNADRIRAMSDEELVSFLMRLMGHAQCFAEGIFPYHPCPQNQNCKQCGIDWLQQPAEEDDHE